MSVALMSLSMRRMALTFAVWLLAIEFVDEFVFGASEAAWPAVRNSLSLSYTQVGLVIAIPGVVSGLVEPLIGVLGDSLWRPRVIMAGGVLFAVAMLIAAAATSFWMLLIAFMLLYPASGAFVSLSQATLIDRSGDDHDGAMARWTLAGSFGVAGGPLMLSAAYLAGLEWRAVFAGLAGLAAVVCFASTVSRRRDRAGNGAMQHHETGESFRDAARATVAAARRPETWRWLAILAMADLMLDVFFGFVALYLVDSAGFTITRAALAVTVWAVAGLLGDGALVLLLRRVDGLRYLWISALAMAAVFIAFILVPGFWPKLAVLAAMGVLNSGWYAIPQARMYGSLPGRSGAVVAITSAFGLFEAAIPAGLGLIASSWGIEAAMWFLLAGPIALIVGLPRPASRPHAAA